MIRPIYAYEPIVSVTYPIRNVTLSLAQAHTIKKEKKQLNEKKCANAKQGFAK